MTIRRRLTRLQDIAAVLLIALICAATGCRAGKLPPEADKLTEPMKLISPLHHKLARPLPGDWLEQHYEAGQTFRQYVNFNPRTPTGRRNIIYIQPLGDFTDTQRSIVNITADFMRRFYSVPVKVLEDIPLSIIPESARRVHPEWGVKQILSTYVLDNVLKPRLPKDAAACIAFTASDLWPGEGWNFVFGQASLLGRVGVWSIHRYGNPEKSDEHFRRYLLRTLKVAVHETGHMFSIEHCKRYECGMCGSNHLAETDRHPLWFCPECTAKVCWATETDPLKRYKDLSEFCQTNSLAPESEFYRRSAELIEHGRSEFEDK
jgi:archaemetzincin